MTATLIPGDELREALLPYRVDANAFEAGVQARLKASATSDVAGIQRLSPVLRAAAAFLPLEVVSGGQLTGAALKLAPATGVYKLLAYLAFPAISLFVLLGATMFSVAKIRSLRTKDATATIDDDALSASAKTWWRQHKWGGWLVFAATLAMAWYGATWLLFLFYIVSLGLLTWILHSLAKVGLGNRFLVGRSCLVGLALLAQMAGFAGIGNQDIHFVDQTVIVPLFFGGALVVGLILFASIRGGQKYVGGSDVRMFRIVPVAMFAGIVLPLMGWYLKPILVPATPARIKEYVESFDQARFSTASWRQWEIVASWTVTAKLDPDLARPRKLLDTEIAGDQNPYILGVAFRVGLIQPDQVARLRNYEQQWQSLLDNPANFMATRPFMGLETEDWVIRDAVLRDDLTTEQRDYLEQRLLATLDAVSTDQHIVLKTPLRATQLLQLIGRPVNVDRYRAKIHDLLRLFHSTRGGGFEPAGGFREYNSDKLQVGSLDATSCAVELMEFYGIPENLDMNWVSSYLRPRFLQFSPYQWMAAVTLERLNDLPGVTRPTWWQILYYERSLLAAAVLVALCVYATLSSPMPTPVATHATPARE